MAAVCLVKDQKETLIMVFKLVQAADKTDSKRAAEATISPSTAKRNQVSSMCS
jgi:hypothetical protein